MPPILNYPRFFATLRITIEGLFVAILVSPHLC